MKLRSVRYTHVYILPLLVVLAGCGAPAANTLPSASSATESNVTSSATSTSTFPLVIKHEAGESTLTVMPERVVTIGDEITEVVAALRVKPVGLAGRMQGVTVGGKLATTNYYTAEQLGQPTFVGTVTEPNIEAEAALNPDLILYLNYDDKIYNALDQVAPTLDYDLGKQARWQSALGLPSMGGEVSCCL